MKTSVSLLAQKLSVSRLANVTGLDRVGYPVVAAIRPLSRNLSVSFGKGPTLELARLSAIMEAAELSYSERPSGQTVLAKFTEFPAGSALNPALLALRVDDANPEKLEEINFEWVQGHDLKSGRSILVPWQAISMDFAVEARAAPRVLRFGGTGLAASFDEKSAILHGLYEVIERDCHNRWNDLDDEIRIETLIDLSSFKSPSILKLIAAIDRAELKVFLWDMTTDVAIPCYLAEVVDFSPGADTAFAQGSAAHLDAVTAIEKALAEALQVRLTYISGGRDDLEWSDYGDRYAETVESRRWLLSYQPVQQIAEVSDPSFDVISEAISEIYKRLQIATPHEITIVSLTDAQQPVSVVKVISTLLKDTPDANHYAKNRLPAGLQAL